MIERFRTEGNATRCSSTHREHEGGGRRPGDCQHRGRDRGSPWTKSPRVMGLNIADLGSRSGTSAQSKMTDVGMDR